MIAMPSPEVTARSLWINYRAACSPDRVAQEHGRQMVRVIALAAMDRVVRDTARGMVAVLKRRGAPLEELPLEAPCA